MKLFRLSYMRAGKLEHMTVGKRNLALASDFAYNVMQSYIYSIGGSLIIEIVPC